jgi:hypothetical protein
MLTSGDTTKRSRSRNTSIAESPRSVRQKLDTNARGAM